MPGSSLWLVPPQDSPLNSSLTTLIHSQIPSTYPQTITTPFSPHVTLTADTIPPTQDSEAQQWLDDIALPSSVAALKVAIKEAQTSEAFFRKLTLRCNKSPELCALASACRRAGTGEGEGDVRVWVVGSYAPHLSLM